MNKCSTETPTTTPPTSSPKTAGLSPEATPQVFAAQSEVISVLSELGVIILLFEIGLESNL
ncbi:MAG: hypothetical protein ACKO86_02220, partial [Dolichospermum sp.]